MGGRNILRGGKCGGGAGGKEEGIGLETFFMTHMLGPFFRVAHIYNIILPIYMILYEWVGSLDFRTKIDTNLPPPPPPRFPLNVDVMKR